MKKFLLLASLLTTSAMASPFSYTNLDLGYSWGEADSPFGLEDLDVEGFFAAGRYEITNNFFAYASYDNGELKQDVPSFIGSDVEMDTWRAELGLGGYAGLADCLDVYYSVGYKYTELEFGDLGGDDQHVGNIDLNVGLRWAPATWVEINPYVEYSIGVDDDDAVDAVNVLSAGLNVYVTAFEHVQPFVGVAAELDSSDDNFVSELVLYSAGLRFSF